MAERRIEWSQNVVFDGHRSWCVGADTTYFEAKDFQEAHDELFSECAQHVSVLLSSAASLLALRGFASHPTARSTASSSRFAFVRAATSALEGDHLLHELRF